jgi:hypothetical protein
MIDCQNRAITPKAKCSPKGRWSNGKYAGSAGGATTTAAGGSGAVFFLGQLFLELANLPFALTGYFFPVLAALLDSADLIGEQLAFLLGLLTFGLPTIATGLKEAS